MGRALRARTVWNEIFGPLLSIQTFRDEEEAMRMANDTVYGLAASVRRRDPSRALRLLNRLNAGIISVNTVDALSAMTPLGGIKRSSFGRHLSIHTFDKYTARKTVRAKY